MIRQTAQFLWNSPTFTTWGNYAVQSLRLVLVTPLILTRFNETEIAAWYLFATLNFFGLIVSQRLGLTFTRMFAFAMGGATNLAPIKGNRAQKNEGNPNWEVFARAYGTIGVINLAIAWVNVLVAVGMGWFGLTNLLEGYVAKETVWLAFGLMQGTALLGFIFQRYQIALQGMNYVALVNRWSVLFGLLSVASGTLVLALGGGLIALVLVMQGTSLAGLLRNYFLLRHVEQGRVARMNSLSFDREVFKWAWEPTWKGFIGHFGQAGSIQLTAVVYTAYGSKLEVAGFLFAVRMMQTITQVAQAPFSSVQPLMARLKASGDHASLRRMILKRGATTLGLTSTAIVAGAIAFPMALKLIESQIDFIPANAWLLFGVLTLVNRLNLLCCSVCGIGNEIVFFWEMGCAALVSFFALLVLQNQMGVFGPILSSTVPMILLLNFGPIILARRILFRNQAELAAS